MTPASPRAFPGYSKEENLNPEVVPTTHAENRMTRHLQQRAIDPSLHSSAISILLIFGKKKKTTPKFRRRGSAHRSPPSKPGIARLGSRAAWRKGGRSHSWCKTKHRQLLQMLLVSPQTMTRAPGAWDGGLSAQPR